jgi:hypothetical protein
MNEEGRFHRAQTIDSNALVWLWFDASRVHVAGVARKGDTETFRKVPNRTFLAVLQAKMTTPVGGGGT